MTSTAADAVLSVSTRSSVATGHLVNGSYALSQPLRAAASERRRLRTRACARRLRARAPTPVLVYITPTSNDQVTINFAQRSPPPSRCAPAATARR